MRNSAPKTLLITGACGVTSRAVVRALKKSPAFKDVRIIGTDICHNLYGLYEGLYERIYRVPLSRDTVQYQQVIEHICVLENIDAAMVIPEPEVLHWVTHVMPVPAHLPPPLFSQTAISKGSLYQALTCTDLIPHYALLDRQTIIDRSGHVETTGIKFPLWIRDYCEGSTSGKGAICAKNPAEVMAWMTLNQDTPNFMVSEFLPGHNIACMMLFNQGSLLKLGCYERLEYFMAKNVISGVSGNISKGKLINDPASVAVSKAAVELICQKTGELMNGLITVDLRYNAEGKPLITEINLRPVAAVSAFSEVADANLVAAHALTLLGHPEQVGPLEVSFPPNNLILRDIDGAPVFVPDYSEIAIAQSYFGR